MFRGQFYRTRAIASFTARKNAAIKIQKVFRGWVYRRKLRKELQHLLKLKDMDYLLMTQKEYNMFKAMQIIGRAVVRWLSKRKKDKL